MDFFGILFDMKNGKKVPYSKNYFDTLFAENLAGVTTLTGTLPLTFTTSETALRSWTIYGNNYEHTYSAEGTLPLTFTSHTAGNASDWSISGNDKVGKNLVDFMAGEPAQGVTINEFDAQTGSMVISSATRYRGVTIFFNFQDGKTYTVSAYNNIATSNARITLRSIDRNTIIYSSSLASTGQKTITFTYSAIDYPSGLYISLIPNMSDDGQIHTISLSNLMLVEGSTTPSTFEPYQIGIGQRTNNGYIVPLSVNGNTVNIPIGNAPLTEGQSVNKTSTGVDIAAQAGSNTITTSLYNKPSMSIEGVDYVGVGIPTANLFMIALQLKAGGQTLNVFNTLMNKPLRAGETLTSEQTGQTINTVAGVENKLSPAPKAASYGGSFNMTIKYKE